MYIVSLKVCETMQNNCNIPLCTSLLQNGDCVNRDASHISRWVSLCGNNNTLSFVGDPTLEFCKRRILVYFQNRWTVEMRSNDVVIKRVVCDAVECW